MAEVTATAYQLVAETVTDNPWIPHTPHPRQAAFLALPQLDAFYGGAAGGGKSDALLMAAAQYVTRPNYAALILRRTYADLSLPGALMDRAAEWFSGTGAHWNAETKTWSFPPHNSTITFGYLEYEKDKYRYQSAEFQTIALDEATQFTPTQIVYMFSRLRRNINSDIPVRFRCASNPGNISHQFVKERYVTPGTIDKPFVPARLRDNPTLDVSSYMLSLAELDATTRRQLELGDWEETPPEGAYYKQQIEQAKSEGRITHIPYDPALPCFTFWDLGTAKGRDSMTLWVAQPDGLRIRVIRSFGVGGEGFPYMANKLNEWRYYYKEHWAPHDISVKEVGSGKTRLETARALGIHFRVVPDIGVDNGISAVRNLFPRLWFDRTNCDVGLRAVLNYSKEWDDRGNCWRNSPKKDWTNDHADSLRMLAVAWRDEKPQRPHVPMAPSAMSV